MTVNMNAQLNVANVMVQQQHKSVKKKQVDGNQNKIQDVDWANSKQGWDSHAKASPSQGGPCDAVTALCWGANMEPYVYVRLLNADKQKTGLADKTKSVAKDITMNEAVFTESDDHELLEDCELTKARFPNPEELLVYLRVYDDDVGEDECIGQAIVSINNIVNGPANQERYSTIPIYDEDHGEMMCHMNLSATWRPASGDAAATLSIKIYRVFDFREDIESGEGSRAFVYLIVFLLYVFVCAFLFKSLEDDSWGCNNYFDAIWFMVITITSVGYGDCFPETDATKIINFFVIIINILCIGWMFSIAVQQMIVMQEKLERKLMGSIQKKFMAKGDEEGAGAAAVTKEEEKMTKAQDFRTTTIMCVCLIVLTCLVYGLDGDEMCNAYELTFPNASPPEAPSCVGDELIPGVVDPLFGLVAYEYDGKLDAWQKFNKIPDTTIDRIKEAKENKLEESTEVKCDSTVGMPADPGFMNFADVLQFTVVTMATVGYGDCSPSTTGGKVYGMFFAMLGVAALARLGALVVDKVMEDAHQAKMEKILNQTLTSLDELEVFDSDGDGQIDKYEFLVKMLVMTHECTQDTIDHIMGRFAKIDTDGSGTIDGDDFLNAMKKKVGLEEGGAANVAVDTTIQDA